MSRMEKRKNKSKILLPIIIVLIIAAVIGIVLITKKDNTNNQSQETTAGTENTQSTPAPEREEVQIYSGTERPIAVMIDNNTNAWPHGGLNDAYMVYEIIVEGGESRLMALFKGANLEKIGPVRSSRHYFLDYVMENDALYAHYGCSYIAESDIPALGINNINGMVESSTYWRDNTKVAPHNAVTNTEKLLAAANRKGYRTTSDTDSVLNYTSKEVVLEDGKEAKTITIPYSSYNVVKYTYNEDTKTYTRYSKGKKQTEWVTGKDITTKNIIITFAKNYTVSGSDVLQELENKGTLKGYYITNGKAIEITCEKADRASQTIYKDLQGNEIKVNDGNTYIEIQPKKMTLTIE